MSGCAEKIKKKNEPKSKNYVIICSILITILKKGVYMVNKEEIQSYKIPGLKALNQQQLGFFVDIQNGVNTIEAYIKNYGRENDRHLSYETLNKLAGEKLNTKWFKEYQDFYERVKKEEALVSTSWTLEMSIAERKRLYELNLLEVDRLANAYNKEIEYYTRKKMEAMEKDDEKKVEYYETKIIKAHKSKNMALASNNACTQALEGLDKLKGLQTVNLNHTGEINFFGDDMWEEDGTDSDEE